MSGEQLERSVFPPIVAFLPPPEIVIERMMQEPSIEAILAHHAEHHHERVSMHFGAMTRRGVICWDCRVIQTTSR